MTGKKLFYVREGNISPESRMFLNGLFKIGYTVQMVKDIGKLMGLLEEVRYRCVVAISEYSQSELLTIAHTIIQRDPANGRDLRIIVMSYPGDAVEAWKRRNFDEVAATLEELRALLERKIACSAPRKRFD